MTTLRSIDAARESLLTDGYIPANLVRSVRPQVLQSWRRSMMSGASITSPSLTFTGEHHARTALMHAANPVLSHLAEQLSGLQAGVLLCDQDAVVVQRWAPDPTILTMMDRINSNVGFCVSEETIGTNGVGTVIESGVPVQISGPEHMADALRPFTCVGVPIHHPVTRRLEGVITMNCRATAGNPLLTPLMTSTAQEVEHRLLAQASTTERHLLDEYLVAVGSRRAPIAAIGKDLFIAGPKVTELLEGVDRALLWEYVRGVAVGSHDDTATDALATERFRIARSTPVLDDGRVIGALVEFDVTDRSRTAGAEDTPPRPTVSLPGKSPALARTIAQATQLAAKGVPILIEGEPGVGKFTLAQAVLDSVNVDARRTTVIDAAVGWIEGATKFVSVLQHELDLRPDALLLRHLESLTPEAAAASASILEALGNDERPRHLIATLTTTPGQASNGLRRLIDTIGVGRVGLAPLRDRREDIAPVAMSLLDKHRGAKSLAFSSAAMRCLIRAPWPGNLRQLEATVRSLVSTSLGADIRPEALPVELQGNTRKRDLSQIEELELGAILEALQRHAGNKVAAAQAIGISRSTLYRKLQAYRIDPDKQYF